MISLRLGKIRLVFEFGFFVTAAVFCLLDDFGIAMTALCACMIHETGHIIAAVICNVKIERITFSFSGIKMLSESKVTAISKDIFILLSGPLINLLTAYFYFHTGNYFPFSVNLILGIFNLLPFTSLDGGVILKKLFEHFEIKPDLLIKTIACITVILLLIIFKIYGIYNPAVYGIIIFLGVCELFY